MFCNYSSPPGMLQTISMGKIQELAKYLLYKQYNQNTSIKLACYTKEKTSGKYEFHWVD